MSVVAICPNNVDSPAYKACAALALRLGFIHNIRHDAGVVGTRAGMTCNPTLPELRQWTPEEKATAKAHGFSTTPPSVVILPAFSWFDSMAHAAVVIGALADHGVRVYVAPHEQAMNASLELLDSMADLDRTYRGAVKTAEARAVAAEKAADERVRATTEAMAKELLGSEKTLHALLSSLKPGRNGHSEPKAPTASRDAGTEKRPVGRPRKIPTPIIPLEA